VVTPDLRGWIPYAADVHRDDPDLLWCHLGGRRLTAPFVEQDLGDALARPFNALFDVRTPMATTAAHLAAHPPIPPTAFIFHTGRCGSTLVAQLLATDPSNRVVSEPAPLDTILRAPLVRAVEVGRHVDWIRTTVGAFGQPGPGEHRLFVKLDSWSILAAPRIDAAFPDVPWLFVARDPAEVVVSQLRSIPMTLLMSVVPPELFGVEAAEAATWSRIRYAAHVQATVLDQMTRLVDRARLIEHPELPDAVEPWLAGLGIDVDETTVRAMRQRADRHGKYDEPYVDDRAEKRSAVTDEVEMEVAKAAGPAWDALRAAGARSL
jgi:hypothetical protein